MTLGRLKVEPFPYSALPALTNEDVADARQLRRAARALVRTDAVAGAISELVGEPVTLRVRNTQRVDATTCPASAVAVALASADTPTLRDAVLVEVESALAALLVTRGLRQRPPRIPDPSRAASSAVAGAFAALLHAALRRANAGVPLRILAAGPAQALGRDLAAVSRRITSAAVTVTVGREVFGARVIMPLDAIPSVSTAVAGATDELTSAALRRMGDAPLALSLVVAICAAGRAELASLRTGDVFVTPGLALTEGAGALLVGAVRLASPRGERGLAGQLADGGKLVIRTDRAVALSWDLALANANEETAAMPRSGESTATLEVLEDAPVVVRVELGIVEMKAREWSELADGDVVTLGRRLGDPAILRVGGVEVARGELVQVEGEYGVRILQRGER